MSLFVTTGFTRTHPTLYASHLSSWYQSPPKLTTSPHRVLLPQPPPQPAAVDSGAETAGTEPGGAEAVGEGYGVAATRGAATGGAETGGADSGPAGPTGAGGAGGATGAGGTGAASAGDPGPAGALRHLLSLPPAPTKFPVAESLSERREPKTHASTPERREPETRASTPERREPETRAFVHAHVPCVCHSCVPTVPGTHDMTLRTSSIPLCVVLPSPPESSLPAGADPPSDLARASSPTVTRLLATVVTDSMLSLL
ncbi:unnamed protein product [Closterium sp. NIES-53]